MKSIPFPSSKIFFFSGTGNAQKISSWMAATFRSKGIKTDAVNLAAIKHHQKIDANAELLGICAPTHGFNFPPIVLNFLFRFPRGNGQSVFIVNTRAGMKMGNIFLPGLSGIAQLLTALIFILKGYKIIAMRPMDMPSNWISIHPGIKEKVVHSIFKHCKTKAEKFAKTIASGKKDYRALYDIIQDLLLAPISLGYYLLGRFVFAKSFYADRNCSRCKLCSIDCPVGAIKEVDDRPFWTHRCESCMQCMNNCPTNAIQTAQGFVIGIFYLVITFVMKYVWNALIQSFDSPFIEKIYQNGLLKFSIDTFICLGFLVIAYRIMHYLLRYPLFERMVTYTSLTSYKFWRRYKGKNIDVA